MCEIQDFSKSQTFEIRQKEIGPEPIKPQHLPSLQQNQQKIESLIPSDISSKSNDSQTKSSSKADIKESSFESAEAFMDALIDAYESVVESHGEIGRTLKTRKKELNRIEVKIREAEERLSKLNNQYSHLSMRLEIKEVDLALLKKDDKKEQLPSPDSQTSKSDQPDDLHDYLPTKKIDNPPVVSESVSQCLIFQDEPNDDLNPLQKSIKQLETKNNELLEETKRISNLIRTRGEYLDFTLWKEKRKNDELSKILIKIQKLDEEIKELGGEIY